MYGGDCDAAIAKAATAVTHVRARVRRLALVMKGWACCVLICHQQKRTFDGWRTSSRDFAYSRFTFIEEAAKPVCTHDGGCPQAAEPKHPHLKGGIDVSSAVPSSIRLSEELLSLLAISREVVSPDSAKSTEFDAT